MVTAFFTSQNHPSLVSLCACGCGQERPPLDARGRPRQFKSGHHLKGKHITWIPKGELNHMWKGGRILLNGYVYLMRKDHPRSIGNGYVPEHVLVMEKHLGRYIPLGEDVHHINGDKQDNRIENLEVMKHDEHTTYHWQHGKTHKKEVELI